MRNLTVRICNVVVVVTPDYSRLHYNLNLYHFFNITIYKAGGTPFVMLSPLGGLIVVGGPPHGVSQPKKNHFERRPRTVESM
jgi:hypothetical protein